VWEKGRKKNKFGDVQTCYDEENKFVINNHCMVYFICVVNGKRVGRRINCFGDVQTCYDDENKFVINNHCMVYFICVVKTSFTY
jgi:hypothetical protein